MVIDQSEVQARALGVFQSVFEDPDFEPTPTLKMGDIEAWDSFNQVNLMLGIETEFGIEFDEQEMAELLSVETILGAVERRLGAE